MKLFLFCFVLVVLLCCSCSDQDAMEVSNWIDGFFNNGIAGFFSALWELIKAIVAAIICWLLAPTVLSIVLIGICVGGR